MKPGSPCLTRVDAKTGTGTRIRNGEKGAAIVEFAILALLLLVFVFGIIEFGFIWIQSHYIANAAREGARVGSKLEDPEGSDLPAIEVAVKDYLKGSVVYSDSFVDDSSNVDISVNLRSITTSDPDLTVDGLEVGVTVQSARIWEPVLWGLLNLLPGVNLGEIREITETALFPVIND